MAMSEEELDRRVTVLTKSARTVLEMFRGGHAPTEAQLNTLDGAPGYSDSFDPIGWMPVPARDEFGRLAP